MALSPEFVAETTDDSSGSFALDGSAQPLQAIEQHPFGSLNIGATVASRFTVDKLARRGGMGAIYRGTEIASGAAVAIKVMSATEKSSRQRFMREARLLAELSHPRIVRHLGHGAAGDGTLYLVMEWLDGEDLAERLSRGRLDITESLLLARQVCEALEATHARGIVHRDIKPANVFLKGRSVDDVRVLDFGIARVAERTLQGLTTDGSLIGTVGYMAPEQALCADDVDARADVFAVGCVLYQCLTGKPPFESAHPIGVLAKVLRDEPPRASDLNPAVGRRIDRLLAMLLAKKREHRLASAAAVRDELVALSDAPTSLSSSSTRRRAAPVAFASEQKIVSVILGRRQSEDRADARGDEELAREVSAKFGADVSPLKGGGMLVVLTGLGEANDRAAQAARCALYLRSKRPELLLAVATGLAETSGSVPVGAAIDRAAALLAAEQGSEGGVSLDETTAGLISARFDVGQEGRGRSLIAAHLDFEAPRVVMGRPTPHVGRDRELSMLDGMLDECIGSGVSHTVLVTGPPGIGKSRFATEWIGRARRAGAARVLFAQADPGFAGSILSLAQKLVRDAAGLREAQPREKQLARLAAHVERLTGKEEDSSVLDFLAEVIGLGDAHEPSPALRAARANPDRMRDQTRRALHRWIAAECAEGPVVVLLEDLHWADASSVAFLVEAIRANSERPFLVLALARPEAERQFPDLGELASVRIRLPRLTARAAQQLVHAVLGDVSDEEVVARVIRTADGNPFYLEELIRRVASGSTEWPDTVLAMAQSRIEQLDTQSRRVLRAASVFGERCWDVGIEEMVGEGIDAKGILSALKASELIIQVPESRFPLATEYRFRHALIRDAAYAMMTAEDRRASHGVAGDWLDHSSEKDPVVLADHFEFAGLVDRASPCLVRAAKAALAAGDITSTVRFAKRGVALPGPRAERGTLLLTRAYAEALGGEPDLDVTRDALELLQIGTAEWWLAVAVIVISVCMRGRPAEAAPYLKLAMSAPFPAEGDVALYQGLVNLVCGTVILGKADIAATILDRAGRAVPASGERDTMLEAFLATARCALASCAPVNGKWQLEAAYFGGKECARLMSHFGSLDGECGALNYLSIAAMHLGRYEDARDAARRALELSDKASFLHTESWARLFLAKSHMRLGEIPPALEAVAALQQSNDWSVSQMLPVIVAEAHLRLGDWARAEKEALGPFSGPSPRLRRLAASVLARAQLAQGDAARALETVDAALQTNTHDGLESDIDLFTLRAEARHAVGDHEGARSAIISARDLVLRIASDIQADDLRASFLTHVEPCARALSLCREWGLHSVA
jgi:tetratricopeptide (TPR) repeat protein